MSVAVKPRSTPRARGRAAVGIIGDVLGGVALFVMLIGVASLGG